MQSLLVIKTIINMDSTAQKQMFEEEEEDDEEARTVPMSPTGQYFSSSSLNVTVLGVLELESPIDDSLTIPLLHKLFLPINPRFSSIMVIDRHGRRSWKKVNVMLEDHVKVPMFPKGLSLESYDLHFQTYLTKLGMERLPLNKPLWELHIIKYPTSNAVETLLFKLHHALGDGYSLIGALLSCLQRVDDPLQPLSFPEFRSTKSQASGLGPRIKYFAMKVPHFFSVFRNTVLDVISVLARSSIIVDEETPVRSGAPGLEDRPMTISSVTFSLEQIKKIKFKLKATINDVITGIIFYGTRLYMENESQGSSKAKSTALVLLNTRSINGYRAVKDMLKSDTKSPWGNHFAFLPISIPEKAETDDRDDPLEFVSKTKKMLKKKKNSMGVYVNGLFLDMVRKLKGSEAASRCIYKMMRNTTFAISNVVGPTEKISLANHPCQGMYFTVLNVPQNLFISILSYMGKLRVTVGSEQGFINHQSFMSSIEEAFERVFEAADTIS